MFLGFYYTKSSLFFKRLIRIRVMSDFCIESKDTVKLNICQARNVLIGYGIMT